MILKAKYMTLVAISLPLTRSLNNSTNCVFSQQVKQVQAIKTGFGSGHCTTIDLSYCFNLHAEQNKTKQNKCDIHFKN